MQPKVLIGLAQIDLMNDSKIGNLEKIKNTVEQSKHKYPSLKLIVFPELATTGYHLNLQVRQLAEVKDGDSYNYLSNVAKDNKIHIVYGYIEAGENGEIYNSVQLIDEYGISIANYRKIHITNLEKGLFDAGNHISVVQTNFGKVGIMICWDIAFPELARKIAIDGADIIVSPSAWEKPFDDSFAKFGSARSIDNTLFLATCNHINESGNLSFFGKSAVYGPDGNVIAQAVADNEEVVYVELDFETKSKLKESFFTMLDERRIDIY